jgi:predicted RNase H-related nuclease YkuK (DUF458 family)
MMKLPELPPTSVETEAEDLFWHALNYRTAHSGHAQGMWIELEKHIELYARAYGQACASAALERAAEVSEMFSIEKNRIHPDVAYNDMSENAQRVTHMTAQNIAAAIRAEIAPEGKWGTSFAAMPEFIAEQKAENIRVLKMMDEVSINRLPLLDETEPNNIGGRTLTTDGYIRELRQHINELRREVEALRAELKEK